MKAIEMRTESPIEGDFIAALAAIGGEHVEFIPGASYSDLMNLAWDRNDTTKVFVGTQVKVRNYRADALMTRCIEAGRIKALCIECDGHEFHRATPQQMARDAARDADLRKSRIETLRLSGARLRKDAYACAREALGMLGVQLPELTLLHAPFAAVLSKAAWHYERGGK